MHTTKCECEKCRMTEFSIMENSTHKKKSCECKLFIFFHFSIDSKLFIIHLWCEWDGLKKNWVHQHVAISMKLYHKYGVHLRHLTSMNLSLFIFLSLTHSFFHSMVLYMMSYKKSSMNRFFCSIVNSKIQKHLQSLSDPLMNVLCRHYVLRKF